MFFIRTDKSSHYVFLKRSLMCLVMFCVCCTAYAQTSFTVPVTRLSYFELDEQGTLKLDENRKPYPANEEKIINKQTFSSSNTAFLVIDPWEDMPSVQLNQYFSKITDKKILPLLNKVDWRQL